MTTNNAINTPLITLGGNFTMSGAYTFTGTLTANTSVTFPTSGTLATTGGGSGLVSTHQSTLVVTATTSSSTLASTGLSVTFTPASSSNTVILICMVSVADSVSLTTASPVLVFYRGATAIFQPTGIGSRTACSGAIDNPTTGGDATSIAINFQDSPATTSSVTYSLQWAANDNSSAMYINRSSQDTNSSVFCRYTSSLIALEVSV